MSPVYGLPSHDRHLLSSQYIHVLECILKPSVRVWASEFPPFHRFEKTSPTYVRQCEFYLFILKGLFFERQNDRRQGEAEKESPSIHWLTPKIATTARARPGQIQKEPGTPLGIHLGGRGPSTAVISSCLLGTVARD